jgi:hypothetical protein
MVCEAALALAFDFESCPAGGHGGTGGGFMTPASAMGVVLAERLNNAGIIVEEVAVEGQSDVGTGASGSSSSSSSSSSAAKL